MTVYKALSLPARSGLIERRRKAGSFIAQPRSQSAELTIQDSKVEVAALALDYGYRLRDRLLRKATTSVRARLGVTAASQVRALECLHLAGGKPFCLQQGLSNLSTVPSARDEPFAENAPGPCLLAHVPWTEAKHVMRAVAADADMAAALSVMASTACLALERRTWASGRPVTHVTLTYPGAGRELVAGIVPTSR